MPTTKTIIRTARVANTDLRGAYWFRDGELVLSLTVEHDDGSSSTYTKRVSDLLSAGDKATLLGLLAAQRDSILGSEGYVTS